jgi:hypothetical protein
MAFLAAAAVMQQADAARFCGAQNSLKFEPKRAVFVISQRSSNE